MMTIVWIVDANNGGHIEEKAGAVQDLPQYCGDQRILGIGTDFFDVSRILFWRIGGVVLRYVVYLDGLVTSLSVKVIRIQSCRIFV